MRGRTAVKILNVLNQSARSLGCEGKSRAFKGIQVVGTKGLTEGFVHSGFFEIPFGNRGFVNRIPKP